MIPDERRDAAMREFVENPPASVARLDLQGATEAFLAGWYAAGKS